VEDLQPAPSYADHTSDKRYSNLDGVEIDRPGCFSRERALGSENNAEAALDDLLETPSYGMAMRSGVPCYRQSPHYWDVVCPC